MKPFKKFLFIALALALPVFAFARLSPWLRFFTTPSRAMIINPYAFPSTASFLPTDLSGCVFWLSADLITGLSDGDPVGTWNDASGNGWDGTASGSVRPLYKTGIMNGKPAVLFTRSSSQWLYCGNGPTLTTFTIFAVVKIGSTSDYGIIVLKGSANGSNGRNYGLYSNPSNYDIAQTFTVGGSFKGSTGTASSAATVATATYNGSSDSIYINGTVGGTVSDSGTPDAYNGLGVGRYGTDSANFFDGHIAEIIIYNSSLGTTNRETVENYLGTKYGITITH